MKTQRWRITFAKTDAMRFTSHLDLILTWERTFRRSGLPLSYSEGFNPRPVIVLAAPLPLGFTSEGEIGDFWLSERLSQEIFSSALGHSLPPGLDIRSIEEIPNLHGNKLPTLAHAALYRILLSQSYPELPFRINELLTSKSLIRSRKGKEYDLRPLIQELSYIPKNESNPPVLDTKLRLLPGATGRPEEILSALDIPPLETKICREMILLKSDSQNR